MKLRTLAPICILVALATIGSPAHAQRILFVGNSLIGFNDMPATIQHLSETAGRKPYVEEYIWYGQTLKNQLGRAELQTALTTQKWDFVILQEQSTLALDKPDQLDASVIDFDKLAKASGARTLLVENWALRGQTTYPQIVAAYKKAAQPVGATIVPLAAAWDTVTSHTKINLFRDTKHPTPIASYMAACVVFSMIYRQSPGALPHEGCTVVPQLADGKYSGVPQSRQFVNLDTTNPPDDVKYVQNVAVALARQLIDP